MTDAFQRRDDGALFEVVSESEAEITLRAYDEAHTVSVVSREEFSAHFDATVRSLAVDSIAADGAGGVRLACGEMVLHLTAAQIAAINAAAANAP